MPIKDLPPICFASDKQYHQESAWSLKQADILGVRESDRATYLARLIIHPDRRATYSADHLVKINQKFLPKTGLFHFLGRSSGIKVELCPLSQDGQDISGQSETFTVRQDGRLLYEPEDFFRRTLSGFSVRLANRLFSEAGYLMKDERYFDEEVNRLVKSLELPSVPVEALV